MNFGEAVEVLKAGGRVARAGWNGKGMFLYLEEGNIPSDTAEQIMEVIPEIQANGEEPTIEGIDLELFDVGPVGTVIRLPHIGMKTAWGAVLSGWLASQTDILAEDWKEVITVDASITAMVDSDDDAFSVMVHCRREPNEGHQDYQDCDQDADNGSSFYGNGADR